MDATLEGLAKIISISPEELEAFNKSRKARRKFLPVTLKLRMSDERWRACRRPLAFPGVELEPYLTRRYPYGDLFAHIIGYVGRVDDKDLEILGEGNAALTHIGKSGLERYYEQQLRGRVGYEQVETNVQGRAIRTIGRVAAQSSADLRLSIDADLQRAMVAAFGDQEGSAVAMDPRTGEVLAMVSLPSYDPNLFVNGISHADFKALNETRRGRSSTAWCSVASPRFHAETPDRPGRPGFGVRRPEDKVLSTGMFYLPGTSRGWGDAHRGGHGWTDLRKSIAESVNTYYYKLALDLGIERFDHYMEYYGFGQPTGIDLTGEIGGILPSPAYKRKTRKEAWFPGDTVNISIGQGDWKVTRCSWRAASARWPTASCAPAPGDPAARRIRQRLDGNAGRRSRSAQPQQRAGRARGHDGDHAARRQRLARGGGCAVRDGRQDRYRTGHQPQGHCCSEPEEPADAPAPPRAVRWLRAGRNPVIAIAVAVEGGGYGGSAAAPIARKVFDAYLLGKMPEGMQPLDSERGTTAIGATAFDNEDASARQAGDLAAAQVGEHPVLIGVPAPAPAPAPQPDAQAPRCRPRHGRPLRSPHDECSCVGPATCCAASSVRWTGCCAWPSAR